MAIFLNLYVHNIFIKEQHGSTLGGQVVRGTVHRWQIDLISCAASKCRFTFWCLSLYCHFFWLFRGILYCCSDHSWVIYWLFPFVWTTMWTCHQRDWLYLSTEYKTLWITRRLLSKPRQSLGRINFSISILSKKPDWMYNVSYKNYTFI